MIESRCGILCGAWGYREQMGYKACCEEKGQEHCGQRGEFPCALLGQFAYDEKQGDGGRRIEQCRCWAKGGDFFGFKSGLCGICLRSDRRRREHRL